MKSATRVAGSLAFALLLLAIVPAGCGGDAERRGGGGTDIDAGGGRDGGGRDSGGMDGGTGDAATSDAGACVPDDSACDGRCDVTLTDDCGEDVLCANDSCSETDVCHETSCCTPVDPCASSLFGECGNDDDSCGNAVYCDDCFTYCGGSGFCTGTFCECLN